MYARAHCLRGERKEKKLLIELLLLFMVMILVSSQCVFFSLLFFFSFSRCVARVGNTISLYICILLNGERVHTL